LWFGDDCHGPPEKIPPLGYQGKYGCERKFREVSKILQEAKLVHGVLRSPNVLVDANGEVFVVDFDWAGTHDTEIYPIAVNPEEQVGKVMKLQHDAFMVQKLLSM